MAKRGNCSKHNKALGLPDNSFFTLPAKFEKRKQWYFGLGRRQKSS
jgi:hypothetical protein